MAVPVDMTELAAMAERVALAGRVALAQPVLVICCD
jgi:hypothetical protein